MATAYFDIIFRAIDQTKATLKEIKYSFKAINQMSKLARGNLMGIGFGLLFTGMQIKRFVSTVFTGIFNTYKMAMGEQSAFTAATNEVTAAWEFFKFSIMDALTQSDLFWNLIDFLVTALNWLSQFVNRHPKLVALIGAFMLLLFVIGAVGVVLGPIVLLALALGGAFGIIGFFAGLIIIAIVAIVAIFLIWNSGMSKTWKIILTIVIVVVTLIAILLLLGVTVSIPFIIVAVLIVALIVLLIVFRDKIAFAFKWLGLTIKILFLEILSNVLEMLSRIPLLNKFIDFGGKLEEVRSGIIEARTARDALSVEKQEDDKKNFKDAMKEALEEKMDSFKNAMKDGVNESDRELVPTTQS